MNGPLIITVGLTSTVGEQHAREWIAELRIIFSAKWAGPEMIGFEDENSDPLSLSIYFCVSIKFVGDKVSVYEIRFSYF